ncbi:hypothetical protein LOAG_04896 [Loa loa]|uniref:Uncharacterized protein n=1 Tax=Loa loa TaxID=7209 RepID=A0A1S0U2U2_LOALO|nr:hypothetical protein LOAG_04896 [Loa loa]EFO23586.1 hypothetical protein LOAG_04896 [Loa loa]
MARSVRYTQLNPQAYNHHEIYLSITFFSSINLPHSSTSVLPHGTFFTWQLLIQKIEILISYHMQEIHIRCTKLHFNIEKIESCPRTGKGRRTRVLFNTVTDMY